MKDTSIRYDGKLLSVKDYARRRHRDKQLSKKYQEAEANVEEDQMTWSDVAERLTDQ